MPDYVPLLKGKEGEFAALQVLEDSVRDLLVPLVEAPPVPYDYTNDRPARSLAEHVSGVADRLRQCWPNRHLYLDLPWSEEEEQLGDGRTAFEAVLADCLELNVEVIPVVSRSTSAQSLAAIQRYAAATGFGACVRLFVEDFEEDVEIDVEVDRVLQAFGAVGIDALDVLVDLEALGTDASRDVLIARSVLSMVPRAQQWRSMILAAASFPEDLSDVTAATFSQLPRREWALWNTLQRRPALLPRRDLVFGDYAISHPVPKELDPRTMRMSASIRYTTENEWLIAKGRNVRQYGFDQYFALCRGLVTRPEFSGRPFSWGDAYIADCAAGTQGPGNATTWRKVGTNHHLTLVARALANSRRVA